MDDKELEQLIEKYVGVAAKVQEKMNQEQVLGGMFNAPAPLRITWYMIVEHVCHRYVMFWFQFLTWPTLALILWRVW